MQRQEPSGPQARRFEVVTLEVDERELPLESGTLVLERDDATPGASGPTTWTIDFRTRSAEEPEPGEHQVVARLADGRELHADATLESIAEGEFQLASIGGFGGMEEW